MNGSCRGASGRSTGATSVAGYCLVVIAFLLFAVGCVFIFNVSSAEALDLETSRVLHSSLVKQLIFAGGGAFWALVARRVGFGWLWRHLEQALALLCLALLLCFLPGIGLGANGSYRWIGVAGYYVQPSEFAKFIIPLFALKRFYLLRDSKLPLSWLRLLPNYGAIAFALGLIIVEPDNRTTLLSASGVVVACFLSHLPTRFWLIPMLLFGSVAITIALQLPYVQRRLEVFIDPEADTSGKGYQPYQAKIAAGSGGIHGRGLGEGLQKFSYLPEAQNDYIVAIIGEELGFLGVAALIHLYAGLLTCGFWIASRCGQKQIQSACALLLYMIGIQVFINLGVVGGLLPSTGLNLPFVSQGGSSLWACSLSLALILDIDARRWEAERLKG